MNGVLGYMGREDETIPRVSVPQTPAYQPVRPRPAPSPYIQFGPGAMTPEQQGDPEIDPSRVNPAFLQAYQSLPSYAIQQTVASWDADARARAIQADQLLLGRPPNEGDYDPAFAAIAGGLQGLGTGGNPLSALGGALMGYAAEKEAYREDTAKYERMKAEQQYKSFLDQRDYQLRLSESLRQQQKDQWEMARDVRGYNRDVSRDRESAYQFDTNQELARERLEMDRGQLRINQDKAERERRAAEAAMPRQSPRPIYRPYGDLGAMPQDPRQKDAMLEADSKEYMARKQQYTTDLKEARQLADKVGGSFDDIVKLLDPGEVDQSGKVLRAPGRAYQDMGGTTLSAWVAEKGQQAVGGPLPRIEAAVTALAQHQKLPGSGVWTDADQAAAREVVKSGDREGIYKFFKAKRDQLENLKMEAADYDKYVTATGGQNFGFDEFRRDVSGFRDAGGQISADKYLELRARIQAGDPEASDIRPATGEDGKPMKDWIFYRDTEGNGRAVQFRWGR